MTPTGTGARLPGGAPPAAVARAGAVLGPLGVAGMDLGRLTTYKVGGAAAWGVVAHRDEDLATVAAAAAASGLPVLVVGRGSNLLVADTGFGGIAVVLDDAGPFGAVAVDGTTVDAGAAVPLPALARRTVEAGLTGFEWAVGVPGSVGGGVRMNAGGHGSDIAASLVAARVADLRTGGAVRHVPAADLALGYRRSAVSPHEVVVGARFQLAPGDADRGRATIREIVRWRREHQPGGQNAGSVFTNPVVTNPAVADAPAGPAASGPGLAGGTSAGQGDGPGGRSAGWLIDAAGLKGRRRGSAMVSPKHANFIQADSGGRAADVAALIAEVQTEVAEQFGVELHPELRMIGFGEEPPAQHSSLSGASE